MSSSITPKRYWDEYWEGSKSSLPTYDSSAGLFYSYKLLFDYCFEKAKLQRGSDRLSVLDCGCGDGLILRFLAEEFEGLEIHGVEYSDAIESAARLSEKLDQQFNLIHGDLFEVFDESYRDTFDVVLSVGLIEHFDEPELVLAKLTTILKVGGVLISIIPNFNGVYNSLWRLYDSRNYAHHVPIRHDRLIELHREQGLQSVEFFTLGVPTLPGVHGATSVLQKAVRRASIGFTKHLLRRIWPERQAHLCTRYPVVSTVCCVGTKGDV
jgi:SAM-dependent methyltransferase